MKLVFATNNSNKLSEIRSLVPAEIEILSLKDINCNEQLPETNPTLQENALQKAKYVFDNYGFNCFADDTGLEIDALGGEPGVYSARYAGGDCKAEDNMQKVLKKLTGEENRTAKFRTVIALIINREATLFEGECKGSMTKTKYKITKSYCRLRVYRLLQVQPLLAIFCDVVCDVPSFFQSLYESKFLHSAQDTVPHQRGSCRTPFF